MRRLGPRPVTDPLELATGAAECRSHREAGLRLLDRDACAGEGGVDVAAAGTTAAAAHDDSGAPAASTEAPTREVFR